MIRYLGIDYGLKRIGLAVSDAETRIAFPHITIEARGSLTDQARAVASHAEDLGVDAAVVGLPMNMDGTEGGQAKITRAFGDELMRVTNLPVHYQDERLSSRTAWEKLASAGVKARPGKGKIDRLAAQVILQSFIDAREATDRVEPNEPRDGSTEH